ncbi:diaminopimelate epimerase [Sphingomonas rubra]|uniref:Diaminopimelate epimerase n=1 Tax=Sphingomonas rubra TaxID=634430 RepID=A0A1I5SAD5_9SPHN|nr:diaminopimelate epimerase [Sphingomonas rubra]SFP67685.1 diaminopimelate epimerase [Sphingomonas rubra]
MRFAITKCHGSGNDFPMIDARAIDLADGDWSAVARALADRAGPVGGDGLLLLTRPRGGARFGFRMFNPDGSEAETCLNGLRCVARMGFEALAVDVADVSLVGSDAGVARDADVAAGVYTIAETAGPAGLDARAWPMRLPDQPARIVDAVVPPLGARRFTAVAMPNPHLVSFVDAVDEAELVAIGDICESAPDWLPRRANVSFVVAGGTPEEPTLFVRTFERGVGLTNSCGSAMGASTIAACLTGRLRHGETATVLNRGGLVRAVARVDNSVTISGNATFEWAGEVSVDLATATASGLVVTRRCDEEATAWATVVERARTYR